jgi:hypothetical protein
MTDTKEETKTETTPKLSILEETKAAIEELKKEREEMSKIKDELNQLRSDQLLSGTAGIRQEPQPPREETAKEYMQKVMSGGLTNVKEGD